MLHSSRQQMRRTSRLIGTAAVITLVGCTAYVDQRGNLPQPDRLAEIQPGQTTKDQVVKILGTPSSTSVFDDKTWYYISRKTKQVAFFDKDLLDQQVFVLNFDNRGVVKAIDHKDMADGRSIEPVPGATPAPGRELTFLEQIMGNVGRFSGSGSGSGSGGGGGGERQGPNPQDDK
jgi:outer membrane protein assembly factor BamE (lipoprotein component of BamABCDE complex)